MVETTATPPRRVAVIDIGSNTIKALVAELAGDGWLRPLASESVDARLGGAGPIPPEGLARGVEAVRRLHAFAAGWAPDALSAVATAAVRDAPNGAVFAALLRAAVPGVAPRVLTGEEEARAIARGIGQDPALRGARDFVLSDLGGGSLELVRFEGAAVAQAVSLPVGAVRLTALHVADRAGPTSHHELTALEAAARSALDAAGFNFFAAPRPLVGTGGTLTHVRAALARRAGVPFEDLPPFVATRTLHQLLAELAPLPLPERMERTGLPAGRADILPAALCVLLAVAARAGAPGFTHSLFNLRYGLAAELLGARAA